MKPIEFEGQTVVLAPPPDWDNSGDTLKCGGLPIQVVREQGVPVMRSFWKPSPEDLVALAGGAHICLSVVGCGHPPVIIYVDKCEELP